MRRTGLNALRRPGPPTGLIIPDRLFSTFCCHGDGLNRDSPQIYALCSPDACPHLPAGTLPAGGVWATVINWEAGAGAARSSGARGSRAAVTRVPQVGC